MSQINDKVRVIRSFRDRYQEELIAEIRREFRDYRHFDVGFSALLKSLIYDISEPVLREPDFRREVKYELKLIMNYLHMVRDRNTLREIKTSTFPMLLFGAAGNRTLIKMVMIATYLSAKATPFVSDTFRAIVGRAENQDPDLVAQVYAQMLSDLRVLATRESYYEQRPPCAARDRKLCAFERLRLRKKNEMRVKLGLPYLHSPPDDPYRTLAITRRSAAEVPEQATEHTQARMATEMWTGATA